MQKNRSMQDHQLLYLSAAYFQGKLNFHGSFFNSATKGRNLTETENAKKFTFEYMALNDNDEHMIKVHCWEVGKWSPF